jgi:type II secretory pathway pseudopilin PulG
MVELLVVIVIIAILTLVALPLFMNQRVKAQDTEAKLALHTTTTAIATFQITENSFDASLPELTIIEPSLGEAKQLQVSGTVDTYKLTVTSASGGTFTITHTADERSTNTCSAHGSGLCRDHVDANGNWW